MEQDTQGTQGSTIITGREQVAVAQLLALASALALEINTGMILSRGRKPLAIARSTSVTINGEEQPLTRSNRKGRALADIVEVLRVVMPEGWQPAPTVAKALVKEGQS